jgi:hypothetical protein
MSGAGKGSKPRLVDTKKWVDNFPKTNGKVDGFVKNKNKITKKY